MIKERMLPCLRVLVLVFGKQKLLLFTAAISLMYGSIFGDFSNINKCYYTEKKCPLGSRYCRQTNVWFVSILK